MVIGVWLKSSFSVTVNSTILTFSGRVFCTDEFRGSCRSNLCDGQLEFSATFNTSRKGAQPEGKDTEEQTSLEIFSARIQ